jgi:hypothetical protein
MDASIVSVRENTTITARPFWCSALFLRAWSNNYSWAWNHTEAGGCEGFLRKSNLSDSYRHYMDRQ